MVLDALSYLADGRLYDSRGAHDNCAADENLERRDSDGERQSVNENGVNDADDWRLRHENFMAANDGDVDTTIS